ncbi:3-phytase [Geopyxis carbonaria]|nr:3-phytase [Geopyxis carbonaria]
MVSIIRSLLIAALYALPVLAKAVNETECAGSKFSYEELVGYGSLPSNFRDKFGDTISTGSSIAFEKGSWKKQRGGKYTGKLYVLPDRGWNTEGTTAYQPRLHVFDITFAPTKSYPSGENLVYTYKDTILFTDPAGNAACGLDPTTTLTFSGHGALPAAAYTGDGFGNAGAGGTCVSLDTEGLVVKDGSFWISDEYGPFLYHFSSTGKMGTVLRPPAAVIPRRNNATSFSSDNPPIYDPSLSPSPIDPDSGRANNQGFEGLTYAADEDALYTLLQSAAINDGGLEKTTNRYARLLKYSPADGALQGQWVVPLPLYNDPTKSPKKNPRTAAQSEIHALGGGRFLVLARDSGFGRGQDNTESVYRHVDVFSLAGATDISGRFDGATDAFAPDGVLDAAVTPATYCSFLDINVNTQLARFGLLNGGDDNDAPGLLNEKWEGLDLVPVAGKDDEYYLFVSSDNDFITQDGYYNGGKDTYSDGSGFSLLNQALVFRVKIRESDD